MKQFALMIGLLTLTNLALAHTYKCKGIDGDEKGSYREVRVTSRTLTVKNEDIVWKGSIDKTYNPHAPNKNYNRFSGRYTSGGAEYTPWYLVQNDLIEGEDKGYMKEQARGEGYFATKFFCWSNE